MPPDPADAPLAAPLPASAPILVVSGPHAAPGAAALAGASYEVACLGDPWTAWPGRKLLLWPDAAPTSQTAMREAAQPLAVVCAEVKYLDPAGQPPGWGPAQAVAEGWDWNRFRAWALPRVSVVSIAVSASVSVQVNGAEPATPSARMSWEALGLALNGNGHPISNMDNALRLLERHTPFAGLVWFDTFHGRLMTSWNSPAPREWRDEDTLRLTATVQRELGVARLSKDLIYDALVDAAHAAPRNEPRDWCDSLVWDGAPRIDASFSVYFGVPASPYVCAVGHNFWVGLAARIYRPGCKLDNMVILEGGQGRFKSVALETIGGPWYAEAAESVMSKDFYLCLQGKLLVEVADLSSFARAEVNSLKKVITCRTDRYRAPYGRQAVDHPRVGVLVGTTNETDYLRDPTGGRRFWPVRCGGLDTETLAADRAQLFAEAVAAYRIGATWHLMPEEATGREQEARRHADSWEEPIAAYLEGKQSVSLHEVLTLCLRFDLSRISRGDELRVASILRGYGWEKRILWDHGKTVRQWEAPTRDPGEEG